MRYFGRVEEYNEVFQRCREYDIAVTMRMAWMLSGYPDPVKVSPNERVWIMHEDLVYLTRNLHRDSLKSCLDKAEVLYRNVIVSIGKTIYFLVCVLLHFLPAAVFDAIDRRFSYTEAEAK